MRIDTAKSRVKTEDSPEVKILRERVQKLEEQIADLKRAAPQKRPPEVKPNA